MRAMSAFSSARAEAGRRRRAARAKRILGFMVSLLASGLMQEGNYHAPEARTSRDDKDTKEDKDSDVLQVLNVLDVLDVLPPRAWPGRRPDPGPRQAWRGGAGSPPRGLSGGRPRRRRRLGR